MSTTIPPNEYKIIASLNRLNDELAINRMSIVDKLERKTYTNQELITWQQQELAVDCLMDADSFEYLTNNLHLCVDDFALMFASRIDFIRLRKHNIEALTDDPDYLAITKFAAQEWTKQAS